MKGPYHILALILATAAVACSSEPTLDEPATPSSPTPTTTATPLVTQFGVGSLIIPMDTGFQDRGALRAYGLVYRLLQSNVPVNWTVQPTKPDQGVDFTITAPAAVRNVETAAAVALPAVYRGGPFVIAAADRAAALPIITTWLAGDTVTVVHDVTAGAFSADVQKRMTAAPNIAVFQDGNELIAFNDLNAAGIPDSAGLAWAAGSVDLLTEAQLAGPTAIGTPDGVMFDRGAPRYCHLTSMHYNVANAATTAEVVREVRLWLGSAATHAFMQCEAALTFENNANGRFLSTTGMIDDGLRAAVPFNRAPADLLNQFHGALTTDTGSVDSLGLPMGGALKASGQVLINETGLPDTSHMTWLTGYLDGDPTKGEVTYLAGHDYVATAGDLPAVPMSTNPLSNGVRLFLNSIFDAPCAVAAYQPLMTLTKAAPAAVAGNTITFTLTYQNTGAATAVDAILRDPLPPGTSFASATDGGVNVGGVVTWNLGAVAAGAMGQVSFTVDVTVNGTYQNTATLGYKAGTTPRTVTSNTTSTMRTAAGPVANGDAFTVAEDSTTALNVRANDTGLTAPPIMTAATDPLHGTVVVNADGTISYTPDPDYFGADSFTYTITDASNRTSTATVNVTVTPVNDVPSAAADAFTVAEDSGATVLAVRANDTGLGDAPITTTATDPAHGTVVVNADGTISYTPDANYHGADTFTYTVTDLDGQTSTTTVTITVTPVDDVPVAVADTATVAEDAPGVVIAVLANDTGLGDAPVTVSAVTVPVHGTAVINANGTVTYTPAADYFGPDSFSYTIRDLDGQTSTAGVSINVTPVNDTPMAIADAFGVADGNPTNLPVLANDTGLGDRPITVTATDPPHGTVTINADGTVRYTPDAGYSGPDSFTYTIRDADGQTSTATVSVAVRRDRDGDGISDDEEEAIGTDPDDADSDDDGVVDGAEPSYTADTDGDGLINPLDPDSDNDGLFDGTELGVTTPNADTDLDNDHFIPDADPSTRTDPLDADTDNGGIPDGTEDTDKDGRVDAGERDPLAPADDMSPLTDTDGDGLSDAEETLIGTDPNDADSDDDGVIDGDEANYTDDTDGDGLINPLDPDSDNDGLYDGTEVGVTTPHPDTDLGNDHFIPDADPGTRTGPLDPDTDDGGVRDGAEDFNHNGRVDAGEINPNVRADDAGGRDDDNDGLSNGEEMALGTDPLDADSDDDGVIDGDEANPGDDTDGDGFINPLDPDSDGDGILDGTEVGITVPNTDTDVGAGNFVPDRDPTTQTSMVDTDSDDGGVPDGEEDMDHDGQDDDGERDPLDPSDDLPLDGDGDGVADPDDNCPTVANTDQVDTDGDGQGNACDIDDDGDGLEDDFGVSGGGCAAGGSAGLPVGLALLGLIALGRRRRAATLAALATLAIATTIAPTTAHAQIVTEQRDFSVERFDLSSARGGILGVEGGRLGRRWDWDLHLWLGTTDDPLVIYMAGGDNPRTGSLLEQRTGGELGFSLVVHDRVGLALDAPLILSQHRDAMVDGVVGTLPEVGGMGLGDLRISPKLVLLRQARFGVDLALVPEVVLPTSSGDDYHGDAGVGFAPYLALSQRKGPIRWALDLGYAFRRSSSFGGLLVDDELRGRGGLAYALTPAVELAATVAAATGASAPFEDFSRNYLEALGGPVVEIGDHWQLFAAGGAGLRQGYGTPDWRALAGLRVGTEKDGAPDPCKLDRDRDGLVDCKDTCVDAAENLDGYQDDDGCPEDPCAIDRDSDGVVDCKDTCATEPETVNAYQDDDGCPDDLCAVDRDSDGVVDCKDTCAGEAENVNGYQDDDGCPEDLCQIDRDTDGVVDCNDKCMSEPEDKDGFEDDDGCAETNPCEKDTDGDGLDDCKDTCVNEPGPPENNGCKAAGPTLTKEGIKTDIVYFKTAKAIIQARSLPMLDKVAKIINEHPELPKIRIEGHTDDRGNDSYNLRLSQQRADAVRTYLISQGVAPDRLDAIGFGETRPKEKNDTNAHRTANRRVEFWIEGATSENSGPTDDTMDPDRPRRR